MHNARRSAVLVRHGSRASSTATKTVQKPLGKWELPKPADSLTAQPRPPHLNIGKWGLNTPSPSSSSAPSSQSVSSASKWLQHPMSGPNRNQKRSPGYSFDQAGPSSSRRVLENRSAPHDHRISRANARENLPHQVPEPSSSRSVQSQNERDTPPHQAVTSEPLAREPYARRKNTPLTTNAEEVATAVSKDSKSKNIAWHAPSFDVSDDLALDDSLSSRRYAKGKSSKAAFKERGSLLTQVGGKAPIKGDRSNHAVQPNEKKKKTKLKVFKRPQIDVFIPSIVSVANLARLLKVRLQTLQRKMAQAGMGVEANHDHMLSSDYSSLLAMEFGRNPVVNDEAAFDIFPPPPDVDKSKLPLRPPVVTIMGHVDHGKTTLLDTLRSSSIAKNEAGGITQHIGAFSVPVTTSPASNDKRTITFLDTPGHAAFSAMRARGAGVTDIVVLVVAADDGIMPQTREVLELIKKEQDNVSLVVAINKVDKPGADIEKVENSLLAEDVQLEKFGGDIPCVHVSGMTGQGLNQLVETISALAEMQDLRAAQDGAVQGYVLESKIHKGLGPVATVLLMRGSLSPGTHLLCGTAQAKVRVLTSPSGESLKKVLPGAAVVVSGWKELPDAGDEVLCGTEPDVKKALANRLRQADLEASLVDMEAINISRREERERRELETKDERGRVIQPAEPDAVDKTPEKKNLNLVVKGDVSGSVEAVSGALQGIGNHIAGVKIVATSVGDVTESDVMRAKVAEGAIVAFSVKVPRPILGLAASQGVRVLESSIIYRLMDDVKTEVIKLLPVIIEQRVTGEATVLQLFEIQLKGKKTMKVAGCRVSNGVVEKNKLARVVRNRETIFEGRLETFRHLKKDITEASKGTECGITLEGFDDLREGDMVQMYQELEKPGIL